MATYNLEEYRFVGENKGLALNLKTGEVVDDPVLLKKLKRKQEYSLEWCASLEANRSLVDLVLQEVDNQVVTTSAYYTFDKSSVDDTAQEIRLMVTDIVLKNTEKSYSDLVEFVRSCINNFARRVFRAVQKETKFNPSMAAVHLSPELASVLAYVEHGVFGFSVDAAAHQYDPLADLHWAELRGVAAKCLTNKQREVFNFILDHPELSPPEIAEQLGYADQSGVNHILLRIRKRLQALIESGELDLVH